MSGWVSWPVDFTLSTDPNFARNFPNLQPSHCVGNVSVATRSYNCFAWATRTTPERWDPDPFFQYYWPDGVPREHTLDAFTEAYATAGFEICTDASLEAGVEKICIYPLLGEPVHVARQLENGNRTTKFGDFEDVEHVDLACLNGPLYGIADRYMKRAR